ncbi:hypothetical protein ASC90_26940 [Rhizobium sp. Root1220]|nr:hypothetical protein ASC90_26940 [Rhizobium sp. Root1220]
MNTGFQTINASIRTLSNELRNNSNTQWPVIWSAAGVCFVVLSALGAFFYGTLSKTQDRLDASIVKLAEQVVTQTEMEWHTARDAEDRERIDINLKDIRERLDRVERRRLNGQGG